MVSAGKKASTKSGRVVWVMSRILDILSGEYLLRRPDVSNGGTVVLVRALHSALAIFSLTLIAKNWLDPTRTNTFSWFEFRDQLANAGPWFGTIFAACYAALYARFASQWTYLAGVYNQIKAAESRKDVNVDVIADWKAGFIEDAIELHLIRKKMFASISATWAVAHEGKVQTAFEMYTPGGKQRFVDLMKQLHAVVQESGVIEGIDRNENAERTETKASE